MDTELVRAVGAHVVFDLPTKIEGFSSCSPSTGHATIWTGSKRAPAEAKRTPVSWPGLAAALLTGAGGRSTSERQRFFCDGTRCAGDVGIDLLVEQIEARRRCFPARTGEYGASYSRCCKRCFHVR